MVELTPEEEAANARANEQARLRKAKREAKLRAGGDARLQKITGLGGGIPRDVPVPVTTTTATGTGTAGIPTSTPFPTATEATANAPRPATVAHGDPDEVDISQHFYQPAATNRIPPPSASQVGGDISEQQLRQMMLGFDPAAAGAGTFPPPPGLGAFGGLGGMGMGGMPGLDGASLPGEGGEEDPMMKMMMQMLGGGGGAAGGLPGGGTNPFASMMGAAGAGGFPGAPAASPQQVAGSKYAAVFRILHTLLALSLGVYVALFSSWTGTKAERDASAADLEKSARLGFKLAHEQELEVMKRNFFWAFATGEALLLTTRYFLDGSNTQGAGGTGVLGALMGFLPQPLKGRVEMVLKYREIVNRVKGDVLVVLFVLGAVGWWRSY